MPDIWKKSSPENEMIHLRPQVNRNMHAAFGKQKEGKYGKNKEAEYSVFKLIIFL